MVDGMRLPTTSAAVTVKAMEPDSVETLITKLRTAEAELVERATLLKDAATRLQPYVINYDPSNTEWYEPHSPTSVEIADTVDWLSSLAGGHTSEAKVLRRAADLLTRHALPAADDGEQP